MNSADPILLFDGVCNLCSGSVQFILKRDRTKKLRFASLQSKFGKRMLEQHGLPSNYTESLVLIDDGKVFTSSSAALKISTHLTGLWPLFRVFSVIPKFARDSIYNLIARNRYRWFGKKDVCWVPDPKWQERFSD